MQFYHKLNELMTIFSITNSRLAKALSTDTSLISRWRTGKRLPSKNSRHIKSIADYFSSYAEKAYQKSALFDIMGLTDDLIPSDGREIASLLNAWLSKGLYADNHAVGGFLDVLSMFRTNRMRASPDVDPSNIKGTSVMTEVFFDMAGKMEGVLKFLSIIAAQKKTSTLLLYSDENMEWMVKNKEFFQKWGSLMAQIIEKGNRIKIIHTVNRDLEELMYAIQGWLPLYMTGAIEPYYYPRYRETIFRRTLFIAPSTAALTSETIGDSEEASYNILHRDSRVLNPLVESFNRFLDQCRPLMRILSYKNIGGLSELFNEFDRQSGNTLCKLSSLSYITMPEALFKRILDKTVPDAALAHSLLSLHKVGQRSFFENPGDRYYTEIVSISAFRKDEKGCLAVNLPWMTEKVYYSASDMAEHLRNIMDLLGKNKNFNLYLDNKSETDLSLTVKEGVGAIVCKSNPSPIIFAFNQENMSDAFYSYLESEMGKIPLHERNKAYVIHKMTEILKALTI